MAAITRTCVQRWNVSVISLRLLSTLALASSCAPCASPPAASPIARPAAIGETLVFTSKVLGEPRVINVYLPPGYATSTARFPVLYMPDGGMAEDFPHVAGEVDVSIKNAVIRPVIVVGIENTERRRDLVGPTVIPAEQKAAPHAGGAVRFRAFLRDELKPAIARRYRTSGETAIIGESLAGLFVVDTFINEPALFDGYIAASPSLWWNAQALVRDAGPSLAWWSAGPKTLYLASADEEDIQAGVAVLIRLLDIERPTGVIWKYEPMPDEHHSTIFPTAALHGVRMVFAW